MRPPRINGRVPVALLGLGGLTVALGPPPRPTLPLGAVDGAAVTAFAVDGLVLILTVAVWYLLLATAVAATASLPRVGGHLQPLARRLTEVGGGALLGRLLATSAAVGATLPGVAGAGTGAEDDSPPVMVPVDPSSADEPEQGPGSGDATSRTAPSMARDPRPGPGREPSGAGARPRPEQPAVSTTAVSPVVPADDSGAVGGRPPTSRDTPRRPTSDAEPPVMDRPAGPRPAPLIRANPRSTPVQHVVEAGESFWSIAADLAIERAGADPPDVHDIATIWQQIVDRNADRLVDPSCPDLLHRGQVIEIDGPG